MGMWWSMKQTSDPNVWDRNITLYCSPSKRWEFGSYKLVRVIDENGTKLSGYKDLMEQMKMVMADGEDDFKKRLIYAKPKQQLMNGHDFFGNVFFGNDKGIPN